MEKPTKRPLMKAVICTKYGPPSLLELQEVQKPKPKENEVLVKIRASAINDYDWSMVRGRPFIYRLMFGLVKPKRRIPGMELAGTIEAIGEKVTLFKPSDEVYGDISEHGFGSLAEYICIHEKALILKPEAMSFEQAASLSHASMLAYQGLIDLGEITPNLKILINGAGGGMGTFAFQIAKEYSAIITGVDTGNKLKTLEELGFDKVIDYKLEDLTKGTERYDLILDAKTNRATWHYLRVLKPDGKYISVGGKLRRLLQILLLKSVLYKTTGKKIYILPLKANKNLDQIHRLFAEGKIKPIIDGPYPLNKTAEALQRFGEGKHTGKVIIKMEHT